MSEDGQRGGTRRSAIAVLVVGLALAMAALFFSRPLEESDLDTFVRTAGQAEDIAYITSTAYGQFLFLGPAFVPRSAVLWLAAGMLLGSVLLGLAAVRRSNSSRLFDPWGFGVCLGASAIAAVVATPPDALTTVIAFVAAGLVTCLGYVLAVVALASLTRPRRERPA